jgi:uncharacterized protein YdhG (YjbR/CyaY superfamily)
VDDYIAQVDGPWRAPIERLRAACQERLHGYQELMSYGMPTYTVGGEPEIAFAKQVQYLSLYIMKKGVLDAHRGDLRDLSLGKGCVRYRRPDQIDWPVVELLLKETVQSTESPC